MAVIEITPDSSAIDVGATGIKEVAQNIRTILSTPEFSCPMERDLAWNPDIDAPINLLKARQTARIAAAIRKYEPRAELLNVTYQADGLNGVLRPVVKVRITEEALT